MTLQMRMVVLPTCLEQALKAANQPLTVLLDLKKLSSILSKEDVAFYLYCQSTAAYLLPKELVGTVWMSLKTNLWSTSPDVPDRDYLERRMEGFELQNSAKSLRPLYDGVFDGSDDYTFKCEELNEDTLVVRLVPVNEDESFSTQLQHAYDELLSILKRYIELGELSLTPAFVRFVQLCTPAA